LVGLALASAGYLGGCNGGTSTEADNPGLVLKIRGTENNAPFHGFIQFFVVESNPTFFTPPPDDGFSNPQVILGGEEITTIVLSSTNDMTIQRDFLAKLVNTNPAQPLFKSSQSAAPLTSIPDFNIVLMGFDSTSGLLSSVHSDTTGRFRSATNTQGDTLYIDVAPGKTYNGTLDTVGLRSRPLGLFVPGTPYYAHIQGDSFHFQDIPAGKLALRLISADGWVNAMDDSLGGIWSHPLKPGKKLDLLVMPKPNPVLTPPSAEPSGQFAFTESVTVVLGTATGAILFYTLDGSVPTLGSTRYTKPITLVGSATIKAIAFKKDHNRSPISVNNYVLVPYPPIARPTGTVFKDSLLVTLSTKTAAGSIYFTLDGSVPDSTSQKYLAPILLKQTTHLKAITKANGLGNSQVLDENYVLTVGPVPGP
jgi:hypothetical protein